MRTVQGLDGRRIFVRFRNRTYGLLHLSALGNVTKLMVYLPIPFCGLPPGTFRPYPYNKTPNSQSPFLRAILTLPRFRFHNMRPTRALAQTTLFTQQSESLSIVDRTRLSYERAKAIGKAYGMCRTLTVVVLSSLMPEDRCQR